MFIANKNFQKNNSNVNILEHAKQFFPGQVSVGN